MIKLKELLNEGPQKVGNVNAFGASKVLGKGKKVLGFVPDTPNAVATLIQDYPQAMEIEFKQGFVYKGENHKSIKRGSGIWKELEKRFLDTATKDAMKAGFKMNEEVNELKKLPSGNFSIKVGYPTFADYEKRAKVGDTILKYDKRGGMIKNFVNGSELNQNAEKYLDKVNNITNGIVYLSKKGMKGVAQVPDYEKKEVGVLVLETHSIKMI